MKAPSVRHTTAGLVHFEAHDACTMQPKDAQKFASLITRAAVAAQRLQDQASGRFEWTASSAFPEVMVADPTRFYLITHNGTTRLFKRMKVGVSRPRRLRGTNAPPTRIYGGSHEVYHRWRCESCDVGLPPGTTVYAEATPKAWSNPNWRYVRLCTRCVRTEELGAALALQGVGVDDG
jgi:hypothetical protein